jgi:tetratricopeptide (TPR) repeat protein
VCLLGTSPPAAHAESNTGVSQATRQLDFAREELAKGKFDKAFKSAESALRLDPGQSGAILLKAQAYEGLDNLKQAKLLVAAYLEEVDQDSLSEDARRVIERISGAPLSVARGTVKDHRGRSSSIALNSLRGQEEDALDPTPYRERVEAALAQGRCASARSAAYELTSAAPETADGWRLSGDAQRCASELRLALLDYRRYLKLAGKEPSVHRLVERLAPRFGIVVVAVKAPGEARGELKARLTWDNEESGYEPMKDGRWRFRDLPIDIPLEVRVSGLGLKPTMLTVEPLAAAEIRDLSVEPEWLGLATINVVDYPPELASTLLVTEDRELAVGPGSKSRVTAAGLSAIVQNEFGNTTTHLEVTPDQEINFDPKLHLPSRLAVSGLPAGAAVSVTVTTDDGGKVPSSSVLPAERGLIDEKTGVRLAPPHNFDSLTGGIGTLHVFHPVLGESQVDVVLEGGALNASTFAWKPLPGVEKVSVAYKKWQQAEARARLGKGRTGVVAVISAALGAAGTGLLVGTLLQQSAVDEARQRSVDLSDQDNLDSAALSQAMADYDEAAARRDVLGTASAISFGTTGLGVTFTLVSGAVAKKQMQTIGPWRPEAVE